MSFISRLIWKSIPKARRQLLLSVIAEPNRQLIDKVLSDRTQYPKVFDEKKFIFIHIPKVAGISLVSAMGFENEHKWHIPVRFYQQIIPDKFDDYFKFTFVRNPWDRVLSAYTFLQQGGLSQRDEKISRFVNSYGSFEKFVMQWLSIDSANNLLHFTPMVNYLTGINNNLVMDFVGKYETLQDDYKKIQEILHIGADLPHKNASKSVTDFRSAYTPQMIDRVACIYERDINTFGYDFD